MLKKCPCGKEMKVKPSLAERKKYCSLKCKYKYAVRPSGLKYDIKVVNNAWIKKGEQLFKGRKHTKEAKDKMSKARKGKRVSIKTEFKKGENIGVNNNRWKGDDVGYHGLHSWVIRKLGKAKKCEYCGTIKGRIEWANKNHKYLRNKKDWLSLCKKCHGKYDSGEHWGAIKKKYGKL